MIYFSGKSQQEIRPIQLDISEILSTMMHLIGKYANLYDVPNNRLCCEENQQPPKSLAFSLGWRLSPSIERGFTHLGLSTLQLA